MSARSATITVDGLRELRSALRKAGDDLQDFRDLNTQVASYVGATAAQRAPRRSGMLAASWRPSGTKTGAAVRFGGAATPYANAVHWGTGARAGLRGPHNIPANRFAVEAIISTEATWTPWYVTYIDGILSERGLR